MLKRGGGEHSDSVMDRVLFRDRFAGLLARARAGKPITTKLFHKYTRLQESSVFESCVIYHCPFLRYTKRRPALDIYLKYSRTLNKNISTRLHRIIDPLVNKILFTDRTFTQTPNIHLDDLNASSSSNTVNPRSAVENLKHRFPIFDPGSKLLSRIFKNKPNFKKTNFPKCNVRKCLRNIEKCTLSKFKAKQTKYKGRAFFERLFFFYNSVQHLDYSLAFP